VRAILDTNILVAAFFWHGPPHRLLEQVREGSLTLISSPALIAELTEVIAREKFDAILIRSRTSREQSLEEVRSLAELLDPPPLPKPICRDPDDDQVLALAIAAQADFIVSGDHDLLVLKAVRSIPILTPVEALALIAHR
jgi:putative PIN family toxin of toxin-antitoxin system